MKKTKIVATVGPSSEGEDVLKDLVEAGVNVVRQNFSHGNWDEHSKILKTLREISDEVGAMMDTQGPEVRLKQVEEGTTLLEGNEISLISSDVVGDGSTLPVDHPQLKKYVEPGDAVLIDDGQIELEVTDVGDEIGCEVIYGGTVLSRKSVNVPERDLGLKTPTEKDIEDIEFGIELGFDFVSASFVKSPEDIRKIRARTEEHDAEMDVIAKIEHWKAVENIDDIIEVSDGLMIARGDLGVEVPASDVPVLQKEIIEKANRKEVPVIIATQMLKSMTETPRATRAEVSDVANAVIDGACAAMLSEETAIGRYPVRSVEFMAEVLEKMEDYVKGREYPIAEVKSEDVAEIIAKNVWQAARDLDIKYIVVHTSSGYTAKKIAKFRPDVDIIAFTDRRSVQRKLSLVWGVKAYHSEFPEHVDEMVCGTAERLFQMDEVEEDDQLLITAGVPAPVTGITNMMQIRKVESLLEEKKSDQE
ncbi:MAG: pyruvate kinase [Candidatus Thermoplasmatota archaeon]|nr:pyruvate kinase [Candidatus Thermoplasmatota archaeon]